MITIGKPYTEIKGEYTFLNSVIKDSLSGKEYVMWYSVENKCVGGGLLQGHIHEKNKVAFDSIKHEMESWLEIKNTLMNSCDRRFYMSQPMILAEKFMTDGTDRLTDYKFFCFNGKPYCVYVDFEHSILFYDMDWNKLDVKYGHYQNDGEMKCPKTFCEMKNIAEKLSEGFPFVRVDLYSIDDKVYAGEMTFNPGGGFTPYYPVSFNEKLGEMFKLPIK